MAALTIRHDGLIASGQTVVGTGRPGSVGVHIPAGLDLVILDGFTIRDFDICVLAESPTILVNCEILRYRTAGVVLNGDAGNVEFCSFLDQRTDQRIGACIVAGPSASVIKVANNVFHVEGPKRYFGLGYLVAWQSLNNIGLAPIVYGRTAHGETTDFGLVTEATLGGIVHDAPMYARVTVGNEVLLLLHSSPAIRSALSTLLPAIDNHRFDSVTKMPKVDRRANKRAVEFLSAGANEMSFVLTQAAKVRILELISGLSEVPFDRAASGRNGIFVRLPSTNANPTTVAIEDPRDIQPSTDMAVLSFSDKKFGASSAYFKPERLLKVPYLLSAPASRKSNLDGVGAVTFMGWVKALSVNADTLIFRNGEGRAQDQAVIEIAQRFQDEFRPAMRLKLQVDAAAYDYSFVVEDVEAVEAIQAAILTDSWYFTAWTFDGLRAQFFFGMDGDSFLRSFSTRAYVFDSLTETMVPAQGEKALNRPRLIVDGNDTPICIGSNDLRDRGWHGYIGDVRIDIGEALERGALEAEFLSGEPFGDLAHVSKKIQQTDLLISRKDDLLVRVPGTPAGNYAGTSGLFSMITKVIVDGDRVLIAGRKIDGLQDGVYQVRTGGVDTIIDNIPELHDIAVDRDGNLVMVAEDIPLSRLDFDEGERREVILDDPPEFEFYSIAISRNGDYIIGDFNTGGGAGRLVLVRAPKDIASTDPATTETINLDTETVVKPLSITVTDNDEIYVLDSVGPKVLKVATFKLFELQMGLGVNVDIPAGDTLTSIDIDFSTLGLLPGDRLAFISDVGDLKTVTGDVVNVSGDPLVRDNAGEYVISTVNGHSIVLNKVLLNEGPGASKQFEMRFYRRNSTAVAVHRGAPLVDPSCITFDSGNPSKPILISDKAAFRAEYDPSQGVVFDVSREGVLEPLYYRANLGFDLSTITSVAVHQNQVLPPLTVASTLRSRLAWHMGVDPSHRGTIKNAAFPGLSDLIVPRASLYELLLIQDVASQVEDDDGDAVIRFDAVFGTDPRIEEEFLNDEYENLSELGIITKDGVVLLGRQTIARMPYDPLSPVRTRWQQGLRISS